MAGFEPIAGIDFNQAAINTYKHNFPATKALCVDILTMDKELITRELGDISSVDVIIGGPPCQGFSNANKNYVELNDPKTFSG